MTTYWSPFEPGGTPVSLSHLEPHEFACPTPDGNCRRVRVLYSPHVFTREAEASDPASAVCFDNRVYCAMRYGDSVNLPAVLAGLPTAKVFQTWEKRNYVYLAIETPAPDDPYHIFFELMKAGGKRNRHIELRVESAYRKSESSYAPPNRPNAIRFAMLVHNIFLGRPVSFAPR